MIPIASALLFCSIHSFVHVSSSHWYFAPALIDSIILHSCVCGQASPGFRLYNQWSIRLELAHQAAAAVEFMHSHNVVHRDLTSNNLLVTDKWEAKVHVYASPNAQLCLVRCLSLYEDNSVHT